MQEGISFATGPLLWQKANELQLAVPMFQRPEPISLCAPFQHMRYAFPS